MFLLDDQGRPGMTLCQSLVLLSHLPLACLPCDFLLLEEVFDEWRLNYYLPALVLPRLGLLGAGRVDFKMMVVKNSVSVGSLFLEISGNVALLLKTGKEKE